MSSETPVKYRKEDLLTICIGLYDPGCVLIMYHADHDGHADHGRYADCDGYADHDGYAITIDVLRTKGTWAHFRGVQSHTIFLPTGEGVVMHFGSSHGNIVLLRQCRQGGLTDAACVLLVLI